MSVETAFSADDNQALVKAIMDYLTVPGRFALNLRQPNIAFQNFDKVIAWAQGKIGDTRVAKGDDLQKASVFFVQRVCFRVENSHYDVLGLDREFSLDALRQRYRALINLTHPDKNIAGLPSDAAVRINKAYDVLRSAEERASYDAILFEVAASSFDPMPVAPANYAINAVAFKDRFQIYIPNVKTLVLLVVPVLLIIGVAVVVIGRGQTDSDLVEKKSNFKKYNESSNSNQNLLELSRYPSAHESMPMVAAGVLPQKASVFDSVFNVYKTIVRSVDVVKPQPNPMYVENEFSVSTSFTKSTESDTDVNSIAPAPTPTPTPVVVQAATSVTPMKAENTFSIAKASLVNGTNLTVAAVEPGGLDQKNPNLNSNPVKPDPAVSPLKLMEARSNLTQLISSLERPSDIEFLHFKLMRQGVSGNVFGVVLPLARDASVIRVDQFSFNEKLDKNHLRLTGTVAFMLATHSGQLTPYRYAVNAEFNDVEKSSAMSRFELKEVR